MHNVYTCIYCLIIKCYIPYCTKSREIASTIYDSQWQRRISMVSANQGLIEGSMGSYFLSYFFTVCTWANGNTVFERLTYPLGTYLG